MKKCFYIFFILLLIFQLRLSADSPRKYVLESFTNTFSEECATANNNIFLLMDRYPDNIIPITYHTSLPKADDYFYQNNKELANDRLSFYSHYNTFPGVPYCIVNGNSWFGNPAIQNVTKRNLDKLSYSVSPITIDVSMTKKNSDYGVDVYLSSSEDLGKKKLFVLLMDYQYTKAEVPIGGIGNSEQKFKWIARKMLTSPNGDEINITKNNYIHFSEDIAQEESMRFNNLYAVAFVQDSTTGEILQANTNFKSFACIIEPSDGIQYKTINPNSYDKIKFKLTNPNDFDVDYSIYAYSDNDNLIAKTDTPVVSIHAGRTAEVSMEIKANSDAFFGKAILKVVPILQELPKYYGVKDELSYSVYYLSNNAKFATIYTSDYSISKVSDAVKSLEDYKTQWVFMPSDIYLSGYESKLFDVLYMLVHPDNAVDFSTDSKQVAIVAKHIENNKKVIFSSPASLSVLSGNYIYQNKFPSENLKTIFNKYIGITLHSEINRDINSSDTAFICGIKNNSLSKNLDTAGIQNNYPELSSFEAVTLLNNSKATPFFSYGYTIDSKNIGVFAQYDSAKIVYSGIGLEQFTQTSQIAQLLNNIMVWFGAEIYSKKLEASAKELNFITKVGDSTTQPLYIRNIGSQDIKIKGIYFTKEPYGFHVDTASYIGHTIKSGDAIKIDVGFVPTADMNVETQLVIENESTNYPEIKVNLFGYSFVYVNDNPENSIPIFPNPAVDFVTVTLKLSEGFEVSEGSEIQIYNTLGEKLTTPALLRNATPPKEGNFRIDISALPKGMYMLQIGEYVSQFIKL